MFFFRKSIEDLAKKGVLHLSSTPLVNIYLFRIPHKLQKYNDKY